MSEIIRKEHTERDHVHVPVPSEPTYNSPEQMVRTIKSITARKIFERCPEVKEPLWEGELQEAVM
jgi:REP element-mobilizing transposase RayT